MSLVAGVHGIVALPETNDDVVTILEDYQTHADDAWWAVEIRHWPFSWGRYRHWWIARRWLVPRDIQKE